MMIRLYRRPANRQDFEECFYADFIRAPSEKDLNLLSWLIAEPFYEVGREPFLTADACIEIGPRLAVETAFSSNAVAICRSIGLLIRRLEKTERYALKYMGRDEIMLRHLDVMTQIIYSAPLESFRSGSPPEPVRQIEIMEKGEAALREANSRLGLGMDDWDIRYYVDLFRKLGRNPTDVECFQLGNANSEHSRHWFFRGRQVIDGKEKPETLFRIVQEPWKRNPGNSVTAFKDNAGIMQGGEADVIEPRQPGQPSPFTIHRDIQHISATAETHNHPTMIAPFPGAETGAGGRIRDNRAVGRGGLVHAGVAGYCIGNLHIPDFPLPGESIGGEATERHASPLDILIGGSNGVSDYGNKIGEPLIAGFTRSFGQMVNGQRREFRKPVLYSAGLGRVKAMHAQKAAPEKNMTIVRIGGPAYRIGVGGGSASSIAHGTGGQDLDLQSVQRGNAEMENRVNRVLQACAELRAENPIESLHDQGAGGPSNVLTELMEPLGGHIDIRRINLGDQTMSVLEIWVAEYQEGYGLLTRPEALPILQDICRRERVNCEILGAITGDGKVVVEDSADGSKPVDLSLDAILSEMPSKTFVSDHKPQKLSTLAIPENLDIAEAVRKVLLLPQVGSKGFLVRKADRSVTGLVARQQCCGPMQIPVADAAVTADGYFGLTGAATALGEQPVRMLISPAAGARMAVAEMLTNLAGVAISSLPDVKCRANWMWAAKLDGEGALLYDAAIAMRDIMLGLGIAIDGGKDSLSMSAKVGEELAISPGSLVILGYAPVADIRKIVTPDFKGGGYVGFIDLGNGKARLGGSAFAQMLGQLGDECPDIEDSALLKRAFEAVQELIKRDLLTAYHDRSDGGIVTALAEMCMAGHIGAAIDLAPASDGAAALFNEEAGMLFEYPAAARERVCAIMRDAKLPFQEIGETRAADNALSIAMKGMPLFRRPLSDLRQWWEETSSRLEEIQADPETAAAERASHADARPLCYSLTFTPSRQEPAQTALRPKVAVLREEGTNGDREMAAALYMAGLDPWDVSMSDLLDGRIGDFAQFRGVVFPGGFSYADVFGSARGWAAAIRFNPRIRDIFAAFRERSDVFSLGVCNGCQLMVNIGWLTPEATQEAAQPRLLHNKSGRFESRWASVRIEPSPALMLKGMEGSVLGIHVAHGEGRFHFPQETEADFRRRGLVPLLWADPDGNSTEAYPYNPNGSPLGIAALCSENGRHLAMMPHPERCFLDWQWPWMPDEWKNSLTASPWLRMFQNARNWCLNA